jgi:hypothetical protein
MHIHVLFFNDFTKRIKYFDQCVQNFANLVRDKSNAYFNNETPIFANMSTLLQWIRCLRSSDNARSSYCCKLQNYKICLVENAAVNITRARRRILDIHLNGSFFKQEGQLNRAWRIQNSLNGWMLKKQIVTVKHFCSCWT